MPRYLAQYTIIGSIIDPSFMAPPQRHNEEFKFEAGDRPAAEQVARNYEAALQRKYIIKSVSLDQICELK